MFILRTLTYSTMVEKIVRIRGAGLVGATFAALFSIFFLAMQFPAQDDPIRIETDLVTVPVRVLEHDGAYVGNLSKTDFTILENGAEQPIVYFAKVEEPITIFLLLDVSGSMANDMQQVVAGANTFVRTLHPDDLVSGYAFSDHTWPIFGQKKASAIASGHIKLSMDGLPVDTMVYDAVDLALQKAKRSSRRTAIVLFSDGLGTDYLSSKKKNLREAEESSAAIYTISFDTMLKKRLSGETEKEFEKRLKKSADALEYMQKLAEVTGGRCFPAERSEDIEGFFQAIGLELREQYSLGYSPSKPGEKGERRKITVKVAVPGVLIRSRKEIVFR